MTITILILIITIGASFFAWSRQDMYEKWMMIPYRVKYNKEFYRFITSGFVHAGYMHLAFNMISFYGFGRVVEHTFGPVFLVALYILGIIVSDIPTYLKYQNSQSYRSLGASGGVSAVIFSSIMMYPLLEIRLFLAIPIPGFVMGILYLIYSYYQAKNSSDNINHDAHFYGAVFGIVFTIAMDPGVVGRFFSQLSQWHM